MNLEMKNLSVLDDRYLEPTVKLFVDGFYKDLRMFSKDKQVLVNALKHSFLKDHYYVGLLDDKVMGILAYSTNKSRSHALNKKILQRELGMCKGGLAYIFLKKEIQRPLDISNNQCYIESVTTAENARGKGIASKMLHHLFDHSGYDEFILEVIDTNDNAVRLYKRLGFVVFDKKKAGFLEKTKAGFNERLYMKKTVE